jgi:hypothetical protein
MDASPPETRFTQFMVQVSESKLQPMYFGLKCVIPRYICMVHMCEYAEDSTSQLT